MRNFTAKNGAVADARRRYTILFAAELYQSVTQIEHGLFGFTES
jgi:hypothetical protein